MTGTFLLHHVSKIKDYIDSWELYIGYYVGSFLQFVRGEPSVDLFLQKEDE